MGRGHGAGLLWRCSPTPRHCACSIAGRARRSRSAPPELEALHLGALSCEGGTALYLQGTVVGWAAMRLRTQSGEDALRLVMAENVGPWLRAFSTCRWKVGGDREEYADVWRRFVEE